jgi:predicted deacetylase
MDTRYLTVEIHDVSPATIAETRVLYRAVRAAGVSRPVLLVIPRHDHGRRRWQLCRHPQTVGWLAARRAEGAELVQHGLTHRAPAPPPPGLGRWLMHHGFARGCAEFAHLGREQALRRLRQGRRILERCGLAARGFVAPAWQQSRESLGALRQLGYRFTAFFDKVLLLGDEPRVVWTPALTFDAPHPVVDRVKRALMRSLEQIARPLELLRVALHPADLRGARPLSHIVARIRALLPHRRLVTYEQWLALGGGR